MSLENDSGMILTGKNRRTRRKACPSATLFTTNPTWIDPGANPGLRSERPATNDLSHGTASLHGYWTSTFILTALIYATQVQILSCSLHNHPIFPRPCKRYYFCKQLALSYRFISPNILRILVLKRVTLYTPHFTHVTLPTVVPVIREG
jgi:hypothetical protein